MKILSWEHILALNGQKAALGWPCYCLVVAFCPLGLRGRKGNRILEDNGRVWRMRRKQILPVVGGQPHRTVGVTEQQCRREVSGMFLLSIKDGDVF